jgi:hypothetical protein
MKSFSKYLTAAFLVIISFSSCMPGAEQGGKDGKSAGGFGGFQF